MGEHNYNTWVNPDLQDDASTSHANDPWTRHEEPAAHGDASDSQETEDSASVADDDDEDDDEESDE